MNPEVKKMWIDALTSGEYKQAKGMLRSRDGHCCLGVLCELYKETHPHARWKVYANSGDMFIDSTSMEGQFSLTPGVILWADLQRSDPQVKGGLCLSDLNDNGVTFDKIAKAIKESL